MLDVFEEVPKMCQTKDHRGDNHVPLVVLKVIVYHNLKQVPEAPFF